MSQSIKSPGVGRLVGSGLAVVSFSRRSVVSLARLETRGHTIGLSNHLLVTAFSLKRAIGQSTVGTRKGNRGNVGTRVTGISTPLLQKFSNAKHVVQSSTLLSILDLSLLEFITHSPVVLAQVGQDGLFKILISGNLVVVSSVGSLIVMTNNSGRASRQDLLQTLGVVSLPQNHRFQNALGRIITPTHISSHKVTVLFSNTLGGGQVEHAGNGFAPSPESSGGGSGGRVTQIVLVIAVTVNTGLKDRVVSINSGILSIQTGSLGVTTSLTGLGTQVGQSIKSPGVSRLIGSGLAVVSFSRRSVVGLARLKPGRHTI